MIVGVDLYAICMFFAEEKKTMMCVRKSRIDVRVRY